MSENELATRKDSALTASMVNPGEIMQIIGHVHSVIKDAMIEGLENDYGVIPGTKKLTLLKPGAEKLLLAFGLTAVAKSPSIADMENGHREVTIETEIIHMVTGSVLAVGLGSCSTMEGKYRYRNADIKCPECGAASIIKGKKEFGGGWLCYPKKGGCGKKWTDTENPFAGVMNNKAEHDDPADYYNTVLKMASKRSMLDGAIRATASSSMFTQDDPPEGGSDDHKDDRKKSDTVKPASASGKKKASEEQGKLYVALSEYCGNDAEKMKATLMEVTSFPASKDMGKLKKGDIVPGKTDVYVISDAQCKVTRHKIEEMIKAGGRADTATAPEGGDCPQCEWDNGCTIKDERKNGEPCDKFTAMTV